MADRPMGASRFVVEGRVQGVAFRAFTRSVATQLGLTGWVRNRDDGSVELEASGSEADLEELRRRLHEGPPAARVTAVREERLDRQASGDGFRIVYH